MSAISPAHGRPLPGEPGRRARLLPAGDPRSAEQAIRSIVAQGRHLSYQTMEAWVDGRLSPQERSAPQLHLRWCARCSAELTDLEKQAARLREPLPASREPGALRRFWNGLSGPRAMSWAAGGAVAAAALAAVLLASPPEQPTSGAEAWRPDPTAKKAQVDDAVLHELDQVSAAAAQAAADKNYARLAELLSPRAEAGDPLAAEALGLLYLRGWGVAANLDTTVRLWRIAASRGSQRAQRNLAAIGRG